MLGTLDLSAEEFLAYAERHPDRRFDFVDGELVEVSPKPFHGRLQAKIAAILTSWLAENPVGYAHTETLHVLSGEKFLPDVSVNRNTADDEAYFATPPLLVVELRSDTQSRAAQRRKAQRYIAHGVPAVLLVMPGDLYAGSDGRVHPRSGGITD